MKRFSVIIPVYNTGMFKTWKRGAALWGGVLPYGKGKTL